MTKREELISKFERNKELVFNFRKIYKEFMDKTNKWNSPAFFDSNLTNEEYYLEFERNCNLEYSEKQHEAIKTAFIEESLLDGYILGIENQYNNLIKLYNEMISRFN